MASLISGASISKRPVRAADRSFGPKQTNVYAIYGENVVKLIQRARGLDLGTSDCPAIRLCNIVSRDTDLRAVRPPAAAAAGRILDRADEVLGVFGGIDQRANNALGPGIESAADQALVIVGNAHQSRPAGSSGRGQAAHHFFMTPETVLLIDHDGVPAGPADHFHALPAIAASTET